MSKKDAALRNLSIGSVVRFLAKVNRSAGPDACWPWTAAKMENGYGLFQIGKVATRTHRMAYTLAHDRIRPGMHILHSCDNRACCNPAHMREGTHQENMAERKERNRGARLRGELCGQAKLTPADIIDIRLRLSNGETLKAIAKDFGVNHTAISRIRRRETWSHL